MQLVELEQKLASAFKKELPGFEAQLEMAPVGRKKFQDYLGELTVTPRESAVLLLFYPGETETSLVMIKRPDYQGVHSGQIAFPGGKAEPGDLNEVATALREAQEEVGVDPLEVMVAGNLSPLYIPPSNFWVYPVVGIMQEKPLFKMDTKEVEQILEIPFSMLMDPVLKGKSRFATSGGITVASPYYDFFGHKVWGATAMIISELNVILRA